MCFLQYAGLEADEPVPEEDLDILQSLQNELSVYIEWEIGDVLVLDVRSLLLYEDKVMLITRLVLQNFAIQHSRLPWTGDRKILASFWDQQGMRTSPLSTSDLKEE